MARRHDQGALNRALKEKVVQEVAKRKEAAKPSKVAEAVAETNAMLDPPKGVGRPLTVNYETVEKLAEIACTQAEIAFILGVSEDTLRRSPIHRERFYAAYDRGLAKAKISLRRAQFAKALEGNTQMLMWLGEQLLGQRRRQTVDTNYGGVVEVKHALSGLSTEELRQLAMAGTGYNPQVEAAQPLAIEGEYEVVEDSKVGSSSGRREEADS